MKNYNFIASNYRTFGLNFAKKIPDTINKVGELFNKIRGKNSEISFAEQLQQKLSDAMYKTSRQNSVDIGMNQLVEGYGLSKLADVGGASATDYFIDKPYDYTKPFAQQVDDFKQGKVPKRDSLLVGRTPKIWRDVGFNALPVTINQVHVDYALNGSKDSDHHIGEAMLKQIPQAIETPVAIIQSGTNYDRVVAILSLQHNGKQVVVPVEVDGFGHQNNVRIDSNAFVSVHGKNSALTQLGSALNNYNKGQTSVFYWNKNEAVSLLQSAGHQLPGSLPQDGFVHSIHDKGSTVKTRYENVTETKNFKNWFGDWQNNPKRASKIVNADGTPKVVYHGTKSQFDVFESEDGTYWFSESRDYAEAMAEERGSDVVMPMYLNIRNPYYAKLSEGQFSDPSFEKPIIDAAKKGGHDGVVIECDTDNELVKDTFYVAFKQNQMKSIENVGTYDKATNNIQYMIPPESETADGDFLRTGDLDMGAVYEPGQEQVDYLSELSPEKTNNTASVETAERQAEEALEAYFAEEAKALGVEDYTPGVPIAKGTNAVSDADIEQALGLTYDDPGYVRSLFETDPERNRIVEFAEEEDKKADGKPLTDDALPSKAQNSEENEASLGNTQRFSDNDSRWKRRYLKTVSRLNELLKDSDFSKIADPAFREEAMKLVNGFRGDRIKPQNSAVAAFFEKYGMLDSELYWATRNAEKVEKRLKDIFVGDMHRDAERIGEGTLLEEELSSAWTTEQKEAILELGYALKTKNEIEKVLKTFRSAIHKRYYDSAEFLLKDSDKFNDLKIGMKTLTSPDRIFKYVAGETKANENFERFVISKLQKNNGDANRDLDTMYAKFKEIGISKKKKGRNKVSEDYAIQWFGEAEGRIAAIDNELKKTDKRYANRREALRKERADISAEVEQFKRDNPDFDYDVLLAKKERVQKLYNDMYDRMNIVRMMNGYAKIPYLKNYFHHFMDAKTNALGKLFRYNPGPDIQLPTEIFGLTEYFSPGIAYAAFAQHRKGDKAINFSVTQGFEQYAQKAIDIIHHTEDIQLMRKMEDVLRNKYSADGLDIQREKIMQDETLTASEKTEELAKLNDSLTRLPNFVDFLHEQGNRLANKQSYMDRSAERTLNPGSGKAKSLNFDEDGNVVANTDKNDNVEQETFYSKLKAAVNSFSKDEVSFDVSKSNLDIKEKPALTIEAYFDSIGNFAINPIIGKVEMNRRGSKSTLFHGITDAKLVATAAIKDVIEKGLIINHEKNWKNRGYDTYVIAARGKIDGSDSLVGVIVKNYPNTEFSNKFYVHDVIEIGADSNTAAYKGVTDVGESTPISKQSISQKNESVNNKVLDVYQKPKGRAYTVWNAVQGVVVRNMLGFNISSALSNMESIAALLLTF